MLQGKMSGRDWMQVLTLGRGVLTSSSMSEHARVRQWSVPANKSQPSSLLVYVARAPCTQARPKSKFHIGNPCHSTCLALVSKWVSTDKIYTPSFGSAFIPNLYSPNVYWGALREAWGKGDWSQCRPCLKGRQAVWANYQSDEKSVW